MSPFPQEWSKLYRNTENKIFLGVCAGMADYFGTDTLWIRVVVAVLTIAFFPLPLLIYFVMAFFMKEKPNNLYSNLEEEDFARETRNSPKDSFQNLRHRMRSLENRLRKMEKYATSASYNLEQQFRDLEKRKKKQ